MIFKAEIDVMPLEALLDPQGKAVGSGLKNMGLDSLSEVRVGKHVAMRVQADSEEQARKAVEEACSKLLANPVMEFYRFELTLLNA